MNEWMNESLFLFSMITIINEKNILIMINAMQVKHRMISLVCFTHLLYLETILFQTVQKGIRYAFFVKVFKLPFFCAEVCISSDNYLAVLRKSFVYLIAEIQDPVYLVWVD